MSTSIRSAEYFKTFLAVIGFAIMGGCSSSDGGAKSPTRMKDREQTGMAMSAGGRGEVAQIVAAWPERPRLGANEMMAKYGQPQEVTTKQLIWHNAGPYKRITVFNLETPHDFPLPHVDYMEHTIEYNVPQDKVADLIEFDASSTINRTVGELSARCDLEGHNILTLNLDHDIVTGKKTVAEARKAFGDIVDQDVSGKHPPYVEALQFAPAKPLSAAFSDKPVIPGSPVRAADPADAPKPVAADKAGDAEVLASLVAIDMNEVLAAAEAGKKKMSPSVLNYAKMLHEEHGMHMGKTMKLGQQIGVTPVLTPAVEMIQKKGAGDLGAMVTLDGNTFERAYLAAMVQGHTDALKMVDGKLSKIATNDALRQHLAATRTHIADHLEKAQALQASAGR